MEEGWRKGGERVEKGWRKGGGWVEEGWRSGEGVEEGWRCRGLKIRRDKSTKVYEIYEI